MGFSQKLLDKSSVSGHQLPPPWGPGMQGPGKICPRGHGLAGLLAGLGGRARPRLRRCYLPSAAAEGLPFNKPLVNLPPPVQPLPGDDRIFWAR